MSDLVGQTIGNYRIETHLGSGGMGRVYGGAHEHLGRPVAIKVMHPHLAADPTFRQRFIHEAKVAASLSHPHIVQIHDFGEDSGRFYLVMELATGSSLRTLLQQRTSAGQPLALRDGVRLVLQAAEALHHAHGRGMVHRDVKPDNVLLHHASGPEGDPAGFSVKIADFGLARLLENGTITATGVAVGTPAYISPEQCQGLDLDGRSDVYSLGIVLYEVVTGYLPFEAKTLSEAWHKHVYAPPPSPGSVRPDLDPNLERAILRCLAKDPAERYASALELASDLQAALGTILAAFDASAGGHLYVDQLRPSDLPSQPLLAGATSMPSQRENAVSSDPGSLAGRPAKQKEQIGPEHSPANGQGTERTSGAAAMEAIIGDFPRFDLATPGLPASGLPASGVPTSGVPASERVPGSSRARKSDPRSGTPNAAITGGSSDKSSGEGTRLLVSDRNGEAAQQIELHVGETRIGRRKTGNDVVLPAKTVSGQHLQIAWDGHKALVTDLDSDNGTWLGDTSVPPGESRVWPPAERLRVGPYWLTLQLPSAAAGPMPEQPTAFGRVQLLMERPDLTLTPGRPAVVRGTLANLGHTVDHLHVAVEGVPPSWVAGDALRTGSDVEVQLYPGDQAAIELTVTVPRTPEGLAGTYTVTLLAHSRENPLDLGVASQVWTVERFASTSLALDPPKSSGRRSARYTISLANSGNAPEQFRLRGADDERRFVYDFGSEIVSVDPGRATNVPLRVRASWWRAWHWHGQPRQQSFDLTATPSQSDPPAAATGVFVQHPVIPPLIPRLVGAGAGAVVVGLMLMGLLLPLLQPRVDSLSVEPPNPIAGQPAMVRWSVRGAESVSIKGVADGLDPNGRQHTLTDGLGDVTSLTLIAFNRFGRTEDTLRVAAATLTPVPTPTPTATPSPTPVPVVEAPVIEEFRIDPQSISAGDRVMIRWRVRNAESVTIEGLSVSPLSPEGSLPHRPERTTIYLLVATNRGAPPVQDSREVIVRTPTPSPTTAPTPATPAPAP